MPTESPSFLTCPAVPELAAPKRRRHWGRWLLLVLLVALVLLAPLVYGGVRAGLAAMRAKTSLTKIQTQLSAGDFTAAQKELAVLQQSVADLQGGLASVGPWRNAPYFGQRIRAFEDVGQVANLTLGAVDDLATAGASIQQAWQLQATVGGALQPGVEPTRSFRDLKPEEKRAILARVAQALPAARLAREKLLIAAESWQKLPLDQLPAAARDALQPLGQKLPQAAAKLDQAVSLAEVLIPMAGYPKAKTYLVLLQNAEELRPTGGFIGNVGVLKVDGGDIAHLEFQDVYAVDGPATGALTDQPPAILRDQLKVKTWFLRDSNWSPDFPTAAERLLDVYNREKALAHAATTTFDGVIALQPGFFRQLLQFTGPLQVQGKTFTADNFFTELEYDVEMAYLQTGTPLAQRKEIVSKVGDVLVAKLMDVPAARWPELVAVAMDSLKRKDILFYDREPQLLSVLDHDQWSGRVRAGTPDYLWVVDANLAAYKTDGVMDKLINYKLDAAAEAGPLATVTLTYNNTNKIFDWRRTRYRDYVRVYVPEGSEFVTSTGAMAGDKLQFGGRVVPGQVDVMKELGKTVFGAFWAMEPGETRQLSFTYRLPSDLLAGQGPAGYGLLIQRQPGNISRLTLDLSFGKNLVSAVPPEDSSRLGDAQYQVTVPLDSDKTFEAKF